jgi:excisionase family DNA binding protein
MSSAERLLTPDDVAERLQVSRRTIQRLVASGQLRPNYIGRLPRFTERELAAYLAAAYRR